MLKSIAKWYGYLASVIMLAILGLSFKGYIGTAEIWETLALSYIGIKWSHWYLKYHARQVYLSKLIVR